MKKLITMLLVALLLLPPAYGKEMKAPTQDKKSAKDVLQSQEFRQAMKGFVDGYVAAHKEYVDSLKLMQAKSISLGDKAQALTALLKSENLSNDDVVSIIAIHGQTLTCATLLRGVINVLVLNSFGEGHPTENGKEVFAGLIVRDLQESVYMISGSLTMVEDCASRIENPEAKRIVQEIVEDIKEGGSHAYFWAEHYSKEPHAEQEKAIPDSL